jgi:hypothetical protein
MAISWSIAYYVLSLKLVYLLYAKRGLTEYGVGANVLLKRPVDFSVYVGPVLLSLLAENA